MLLVINCYQGLDDIPAVKCYQVGKASYLLTTVIRWGDNSPVVNCYLVGKASYLLTTVIMWGDNSPVVNFILLFFK